MPKIRAIILGLLTALAVNASVAVVLTDSASAHEFFIEEKSEGAKEPTSFLGFSGPGIYYIRGNWYACLADYYTGAGRRIGIGCVAVIVGPGGKRQVQTKCTIKNGEIVEEFKGELTGKGELLEKGANTEEILAEIAVEGTECESKGTYKLKGGELCAIPEAEFQKVLHQLICTPAGSKLKALKEGTELEAQLWTTEGTFLSGNKKWSSN
jgi:hypothetical protein